MLKVVLSTVLLHTIKSQECGFTYADNYAFSGSYLISTANTLESAKASCKADNTCLGFYKSNTGNGYNLFEGGDWKEYPTYEGWKKECPVSVPPDCSYQYANNYAFSGSDFFFIASTLSSAKAFCSSNADCVGFHRTMSQAGYYIMRSGDWEVDSNFEGWKKDCTARNAPAQCITTICDLQGKIDSIYDAVITTSAHGFEGNNAIDFDVNNKKITFSFTHFEFTLLVFVIALSLASIGLCILFAFRKVLTNQRMEYSKVQNVIEEQ
eukprot:94994_1